MSSDNTYSNAQIDLSAVKYYFFTKFKTKNIKICDIKSYRTKKLLLTILIENKKYCVTIRKDNRLCSEYAVMNLIPSFAPNIIFFDRTRKRIPYDIMLTKYIKKDSPHNYLSYDTINFHAIGEAIQKLHNLQQPIPGLHIENKFKKTHNNVTKKANILKNKFPSLYHDILEHLKNIPIPQNPLVLSHNDLGWYNIIIENNNPIIIDFESLGYNIKEYDLAQVLFASSPFPIKLLNKNIIKATSYLLDCLKKNPSQLILRNKKLITKYLDITKTVPTVKFENKHRNKILAG